MAPCHLVSITREASGPRGKESLGSSEGESKQKTNSYGLEELAEKLGQGFAGQRLVCTEAHSEDAQVCSGDSDT